MKSPEEIYTDDLHNALKYYASWPPNEPVKLGDFGLLDDNRFIHQGNITERFGIQFQQIDNQDQPADWDYSTSGAVSIAFHAKADATPGGVPVKASVDFNFSSQSAVYFKAAGCIPSYIADQVALGQQVMQLYEDGKWDDKWAVVRGLMKAGATTILISGSSDSSFSVEASSDNVARIDLGDASIGLSIKSTNKMDTAIIAQKGLTPLIGLSQIQGWWEPEFKPKAMLEYRRAKSGNKKSSMAASKPFYFGRV